MWYSQGHAGKTLIDIDGVNCKDDKQNKNTAAFLKKKNVNISMNYILKL